MLVFTGPWLEKASAHAQTSPGPDARDVACKFQNLEQSVIISFNMSCV